MPPVIFASVQLLSTGVLFIHTVLNGIVVFWLNFYRNLIFFFFMPP